MKAKELINELSKVVSLEGDKELSIFCEGNRSRGDWNVNYVDYFPEAEVISIVI